jgi:glutamine amidotransferase
MNVGIINCGLGNIHSISKCIDDLGFKNHIINNPRELIDCEKIIFPGVGSFSKAMKIIEKDDWITNLKKKSFNRKNLFFRNLYWYANIS